MNSKIGGMNPHQTIGMVRTAAKIPAGAPPRRLAVRIAGKKAAKCSVAPKEAKISCMVVAKNTANRAARKVETDQGLSLRR